MPVGVISGKIQRDKVIGRARTTGHDETCLSAATKNNRKTLPANVSERRSLRPLNDPRGLGECAFASE